MPCKPAGWPPRMHLSIHVLLHWAWSSPFTLGQMQHKSNLSISLLHNVSNLRLPGKAACQSKCRNAYDYINAYHPAWMQSCVLKLRLSGCLPEWMHIFIRSTPTSLPVWMQIFIRSTPTSLPVWMQIFIRSTPTSLPVWMQIFIRSTPTSLPVWMQIFIRSTPTSLPVWMQIFIRSTPTSLPVWMQIFIRSTPTRPNLRLLRGESMCSWTKEWLYKWSLHPFYLRKKEKKQQQQTNKQKTQSASIYLKQQNRSTLSFDGPAHQTSWPVQQAARCHVQHQEMRDDYITRTGRGEGGRGELKEVLPWLSACWVCNSSDVPTPRTVSVGGRGEQRSTRQLLHGRRVCVSVCRSHTGCWPPSVRDLASLVLSISSNARFSVLCIKKGLWYRAVLHCIDPSSVCEILDRRSCCCCCLVHHTGVLPSLLPVSLLSDSSASSALP